MLPARYDTLDGVTTPLVDSAALAAELAGDRPPLLLDVRWSLAGTGPADYAAGHLPGAVFADLDADLCGPPGPGGRHPLPEPGPLQAALRRLGVRAGHPVVAYDAGGATPTGAAARAWWTLRWADHADVRVLDGGYAAWLAAGLPVTTEPVTPAPGDVTVRPGGMPTADAPTATAGVLVDARAGARYRGESEPVDPVAGHIPGAVNQPATVTVGEDGRLLAPDALRAAYARLGVRPDRPVAAYCGSGVTAAQTVLALTVAGYRPALYVGSWSHWITDPARPVATGEDA
jgi:thiosulfate/3-mercaptopyruvate sulfurtransferase